MNISGDQICSITNLISFQYIISDLRKFPGSFFKIPSTHIQPSTKLLKYWITFEIGPQTMNTSRNIVIKYKIFCERHFRYKQAYKKVTHTHAQLMGFFNPTRALSNKEIAFLFLYTCTPFHSKVTSQKRTLRFSFLRIFCFINGYLRVKWSNVRS